jgi:hypothetical protein
VKTLEKEKTNQNEKDVKILLRHLFAARNTDEVSHVTDQEFDIGVGILLKKIPKDELRELVAGYNRTLRDPGDAGRIRACGGK